MKNFLSILRYLLLAVCLCVMCYSGWRLWQIYQTYQEGKDCYDELSSMVVTEAEQSDASSSQESSSDTPETGASTQTSDVEIGITVDFDLLQEVNSDVVAWIYGPDTMINYPVVQCDDNSYYLNHLIDRSTNSSGTIFVETQNSSDFTDQNTLIYGHHMKNGSMFAGLEQYRDQEYYQQHPFFYLLTPEQNYQLQIFSACVVSSDDEVYQITFDGEEKFLLWANRQAERSDISTGVSLTGTDRIITLSTCAYDFDNARYVVLAKLVPIGTEQG